MMARGTPPAVAASFSTRTTRSLVRPGLSHGSPPEAPYCLDHSVLALCFVGFLLGESDSVWAIRSRKRTE